MYEWQLRNTMLIGDAAMAALRQAHVAVVGIGGVGGFAVEGLTRAGVGRLTLVDHDDISVTNINRQIIATHQTVGQPKAEAMAARIADIAPETKVDVLKLRYHSGSRDEFFIHNYDYIIDAIDLVSCKLDLIEQALERKIPIISALGTGNKRDVSQLRVADISKTTGCPLARVIRKELRNREIRHHMVVYSPEEGVTPLDRETPPEGRRSVPSSMVFVPACAGLYLASFVVSALTEGTQQFAPAQDEQ